MRKIICENVTDKSINIFSENELLFEINRDRSESWIDYTLDDLTSDTRITDALSLTDLVLIEVLNG